MMNYEIATHLPGARNDNHPSCHCEERSDEAISWAIKFPVGIRAESWLLIAFGLGLSKARLLRYVLDL